MVPEFTPDAVSPSNVKVVEEGTHTELVAKKGEYYRLVKNQLELGS